MDKKKLVVILSWVAGAVVILGVVIALMLTPITSFLHGGTGEDFHKVGSCAGRTTRRRPRPRSIRTWSSWKKQTLR